MRRTFLAAILAMCVSGAAAQQTLYTNANIYTVDPARPRAAAMLVDGAKIVAVGSEAEARAAAGPGATLVDLEGKTVLPGLIDAHGHMAGLGAFGIGVLDFGMARSFEQVVGTVADATRQRPACVDAASARVRQ